jgi:hypothetical protein
MLRDRQLWVTVAGLAVKPDDDPTSSPARVTVIIFDRSELHVAIVGGCTQSAPVIFVTIVGDDLHMRETTLATARTDKRVPLLKHDGAILKCGTPDGFARLKRKYAHVILPPRY